MINKPGSCDLINEALLKIQKELTSMDIKAESTANTGKFSFKYSSLPDLLKLVRPLFDKYNILLEQDTTVSRDGLEMLRLRLTHVASGQYTESLSLLSQEYEDYKGWGGENTYKRRYMLMGKLGIFPCKDNSEEKSYSKTYSQYISEAQQRLLYMKLKGKEDKMARVKSQYGEFNKIPKTKFNSILEWIEK